MFLRGEVTRMPQPKLSRSIARREPIRRRAVWIRLRGRFNITGQNLTFPHGGDDKQRNKTRHNTGTDDNDVMCHPSVKSSASTALRYPLLNPLQERFRFPGDSVVRRRSLIEGTQVGRAV